MARDDYKNEGDAKFSYGVRELQKVHKRLEEPLRLEGKVRKATGDSPGFDPYNTSGGFDRKKHWARVGKR